MESIDFLIIAIILALIANNVFLFIRLQDSERREEEWEAEARKVLTALINLQESRKNE